MPIGDSIGDWLLPIDIGDFRLSRAGSVGTIDNPNEQSSFNNPIANHQSQSTIFNRQSVNRQSALDNLQSDKMSP
jgi:hypothetical protein